jgi:hypothetical protein
MVRLITLAAALMLAGAAHAAAPEPVVQIADVELFYRVYDAAGGHPSAEAVQRDYLDAGSDGLRTFARVRRTTAERIAEAIATRPEIYEKGRKCAGVLPATRKRLQKAMANLAGIYDDAKFPIVTVAIGRGRPVAVGSPTTAIQIGLEALCATDFLHSDLEDRFVYVIAHEFAHAQQAPMWAEREEFTVLERSLVEGAAEFLCELMAGNVAYAHLRAKVAGREKEIESAFAAEVDSKDLSNWLDNTGRHADPDLGYWVGYRIVRAYYEKATDKKQAIRDILEMTDAHAFLGASGWRPGMSLGEH